MVRLSDPDAFIDATLTLLREHDLPPRFVDRRAGIIETRPATSGQFFEIWRDDVHGGYQLLESSLHTVRRQVAISLQPVDADDLAGPAQPGRAPAAAPRPIAAARAAPPPARTARQPTQPGVVVEPLSPPRTTPAPRPSASPRPVRPGAVAARPAPDAPAPDLGPRDYWLTIEVRKQRLEAPERQITTASGALGIYSERVPTIEGVRGPASATGHWAPLGRDVPLESHLIERLSRLAR